MDCSFCHATLTDEEAENPQTDDDGNVLCDHCYCALYHFTCCLCLEHGDTHEQHNLVAVFDAKEVFVFGEGDGPGIYRVNTLPDYGGPLLGACRILAQDVARVADLPADADPMNADGPYGHLCAACQAKITQATTP